MGNEMSDFDDLCDSIRSNSASTCEISTGCLSAFNDDHAALLSNALLHATVTTTSSAATAAAAAGRHASAAAADPVDRGGADGADNGSESDDMPSLEEVDGVGMVVGDDNNDDDDPGGKNKEKKKGEVKEKKQPNTRVRKIEIHMSNLSAAGCRSLGKALRQLPALRHVQLSGFQATPFAADNGNGGRRGRRGRKSEAARRRRNRAAIRCMLEELRQCRKLTEINLLGLDLTDVSSSLRGLLADAASANIKSVCLAAPIIAPPTPPLAASLSGHAYSGDDGKAANFAEAFVGNASMEHINLFDVPNPILNALLPVLEDHPTLRWLKLDFDNGVLDDTTVLQEFLENNQTGVEHLMWSRSGDGMSIEPILNSLRRNTTVKNLHVVDMSSFGHHPNDAVALKNLLRSNTTIEKLTLTSDSLVNEQFRHLAEGLYRNSSLKELDLSDNRLHGMQAAKLLRAIIQRNKGLVRLDVCHNHFGGSQGTRLIANALRRNTTLQEFFINNLRYMDEDISIIARALASNRRSSLKSISACGNYIGPLGIMALIRVMPQTKIETLILSGNRPLGHRGVQLLATHLQHPDCKLKILILDRTEMGDLGLVALTEALPNNTSLEFLSIEDNYFTPEGLVTLFRALPRVHVKRLDFEWQHPMFETVARRGHTSSELEALFVECIKDNESLTAIQVGGHDFSAHVKEKVNFYMERNRFRPLLLADEVTGAPPALWPHAFARLASFASREDHGVTSALYSVIHSKIAFLLQNQIAAPNPRKRSRSLATSTTVAQSAEAAGVAAATSAAEARSEVELKTKAKSRRKARCSR